MITKSKTKLIIKSISLDGTCTLSIVAEKQIKSVKLNIAEETSGREFAFSFDGNINTVSGSFKIDNPVLWDLNSPNLYTYNAVIDYAEESESINGKFGIRELKSAGKNIYLNGNPVFIRGYIRGTKAHEHLNNTGMSDLDFYRKNISQAKKFGFNYIRFHSVVPNEDLFKAADELGMLIHIEFREPTDEYENLKEMVTTEKNFVSKEFIERKIYELCDHPSLAVYCVGNEIKGDKQKFIDEIREYIKTLDSTRLFIDTCAWGKNNRAGVDFDVQHMSYYFPYAKHADMYENTDNLLVCGVENDAETVVDGENFTITRDLHFNVPLLAHEVCHYSALRDFKELKAKFKKAKIKEPWWIDEELKMIDKKGFSPIYDEMFKASKTFQLECYKTAFECIRSSKVLGGYMFLQFADTDAYENSNGVVDCFDDINYIKPEDFIKFNGDVVLIAKLKGRIYSEGQQVLIPFVLSNCGNDSVKYADFSFELSDGEKIYSSGKMSGLSVERKGLYDLLRLNIKLPGADKPTCLVLSAGLSDGKDFNISNSWKIWVYPNNEPVSLKEFCSYKKGDAVVTDDIEKALGELKQGNKVCLIYRSRWTRHLLDKKMPSPKYAFPATWNRFKPVIWDRGTNFGGLNKTEILNKYGFNTGKYYDFDLSVLSEDCDKIDLTDFPVKVNNILFGIDKNVRDRFDAGAGFFNLKELQYDRTLRDFSYLFEVAVGSGKLLVCGLNMLGLDENEPSTLAFAKFIMNYISSKDFNPTAKISQEQFIEYLTEHAKKPVKERMMTQFWELDNTPVESEQYWKESEEYLK